MLAVIILIFLLVVIIVIAFTVVWYMFNKNKNKKIIPIKEEFSPITSLRKESIFSVKENKATVNFVVVNVSTHIPMSMLEEVIYAVEIHTQTNFAPHWGTHASFTLLGANTYPSLTQLEQGNVLVYITDNVEGGHSNFKGVASHWMTLPAPEDRAEGSGPQPKSLVPNLPIVPLSIPIIFIPYGNLSYGLRSTTILASETNTKHALGEALSHEVFETLINPFPTGSGANFQVFVGREYTYMYITEVCDPNEKDTPLYIEGIRVANFVTRDYFNPFTPEGISLDWAGRIHKPLTPVEGRQYGLLVDHRSNKLVLFVDVAQGTTLTRYEVGSIHTAFSKLTLQGLRYISRDMTTLPRLDYSLLPS